MADKQGTRISQLVRVMIRELDAYKGGTLSRNHYNAFRKAKRELYAMRPDIAPGILKFVVSSTHWGTSKGGK